MKSQIENYLLIVVSVVAVCAICWGIWGWCDDTRTHRALEDLQADYDTMLPKYFNLVEVLSHESGPAEKPMNEEIIHSLKAVGLQTGKRFVDYRILKAQCWIESRWRQEREPGVILKSKPYKRKGILREDVGFCQISVPVGTQYWHGLDLYTRQGNIMAGAIMLASKYQIAGGDIHLAVKLYNGDPKGKKAAHVKKYHDVTFRLARKYGYRGK